MIDSCMIFLDEILSFSYLAVTKKVKRIKGLKDKGFKGLKGLKG